MSDKDEPKNPMEEFQKQIQELFKKGNMPNFSTAPSEPTQAAEGASPTGESTSPGDKAEEILRRIEEFSLKPREIKDYLDRFVIKQDEAKKVISVAICDHYNHVRQCLENSELLGKEYAKQNILLLGPTGVGKTYLMRCIAKLIGVPFVKADATKFSETGYVGGDVDDLVRDLVRNADGNTELAQYGIVYIDEIDKIAAQPSSGGKDVSGRGVQINLLKLMEDADVNLHSQTDILGQMQAVMEMQRGGKPGKRTLNTRHILFIVSGAFDKLGEQIQKRIQSSQVGFASTQREPIADGTDPLFLAQSTDFIEYGFEPEFVGRLPIRVPCQPLETDDLEAILLQSEGSILSQYRSDFEGYKIDFNMSDDSVHKIAELAQKENTGARGLMTVLEKVFRNFKYELPSTSIKTFDVTEDTIEEPGDKLKKLLKENESGQRNVLRADVAEFAKRFRKQYTFELQFNEEAIEELVNESLEQHITIRALCESKFHDFHHGITLISRNSGKKSFPIDKKTAEDPEKELSRWVVESFKELQSDSESKEKP